MPFAPFHRTIFKLIIANIQRHAHSHTHIRCGNSRISGEKSFSRYFFKTSLKLCRVRLLLASTVWPIVQSEMRASAQHIHFTFFIFLFHKKVLCARLSSLQPSSSSLSPAAASVYLEFERQTAQMSKKKSLKPIHWNPLNTTHIHFYNQNHHRIQGFFSLSLSLTPFHFVFAFPRLILVFLFLADLSLWEWAHIMIHLSSLEHTNIGCRVEFRRLENEDDDNDNGKKWFQWRCSW